MGAGLSGCNAGSVDEDVDTPTACRQTIGQRVPVAFRPHVQPVIVNPGLCVARGAIHDIGGDDVRALGG